jgi:hypothetical protein
MQDWRKSSPTSARRLTSRARKAPTTLNRSRSIFNVTQQVKIVKQSPLFKETSRGRQSEDHWRPLQPRETGKVELLDAGN